ncbi:MAG TPA: polynucleotide adenylyltransferase PcnB [Candidatus Binataceae bacterium]|nr:polynucleotide adenylyltransferase PcnB [Candidatus Binataceae bacterium]
MEPRILERAEHPISRRNIDANVLKVLYRLINAGHVAYLVGGGVRDLMLERRPKDFDVGTSAHPQQVRDLFRNSRLIGRRFRLAHVFFGPQNVEVATFRRRSEIEPQDGDPLIRQDNTFGTPEEDALRRDFTINSLFYDPRTFRVIDYVGGLPDLQARVIRTVSDPEVRMREDPVRMIRAIRFAAKLDFAIEPATRAAIRTHREDLLKASTPRLIEEIFRTFSAAPPARALVLMEELGLLDVALPFLSQHIRSGDLPLYESATVRNLARLDEAMTGGFEPSRAFTLACLFTDLHLSPRRQPPSQPPAAELHEDLRARGFPRGDTERMRLLLNALVRMMNPTARLRGLHRRPYFVEAKALHDLLAAGYPASAKDDVGGDKRTRRRRRPSRRRRRRSAVSEHPQAVEVAAAEGTAVAASGDAEAGSANPPAELK